MSIVVDVLVGHILDNKWRVCKIRNMNVDDFYNDHHNRPSMDGSYPSFIFCERQPISNQSL